MTAVAIVIIVGGILALSALTWFIAQLYAQQQRAEERVRGMRPQPAWLNGRELAPPAPALPPRPAETPVAKQLSEPMRSANPAAERDQPAETVDRAPAAPA